MKSAVRRGEERGGERSDGVDWRERSRERELIEAGDEDEKEEE